MTDCTLTVGAGTGVSITSAGVRLEGNTISGNGDTDYGIRVNSDGGDENGPEMVDNTIEDISNGAGIYVTGSGPDFTENTVQDNKWGFYLTGGAAEIGYASDSNSDNFITGNTRGIYSACVGPGACPTCTGFAPTVRNSTISSNTTGVYVEKRGFIDLGNSSQSGNNTLTSNSAYCIRNAANCDTIRAQGNWFGAYPPTVCWSGWVDAINFLSSAPAGRESDIAVLNEHPSRLGLLGVFPNPTQAGGTIRFTLDQGTAAVSVQIYDVAGRLIRDFGSEIHQAGLHEVRWDGRNDHGQDTPAGLYFVRVAAANNLVQNTKVLVVR